MPRAPLAQPRLKGDWIDRVIDYMNRNNYWYSRFPGCRNIVYLEGADEDGAPNEDAFDQFNDLRAVFWFDDDGQDLASGVAGHHRAGRVLHQTPR